MKKSPFSALLLIFAGVNLFGQIPAGYYSSAEGKTGVALQAALHNIIKNHTSVAYNSLYSYFQYTDVRPNGTVWDMYSDVPGGTPPYNYHYVSADECGSYNGEGDCFNREHSFPASWFNDGYPMYSDIFHLYPTDGYVNNRRSNYPFGDVGSSTWTSENGSRLGSCTDAGYSGTVFEPIDAYKGDFARSMFYMATRYYTEDGSWPGSPMTNGSQLKTWALTAMMAWSEQDPVSQKETDRNNYIYYHVQNNRNPFIDHPEYVALIWDPSAGMGTLTEQKLALWPNPANDQCSVDIPEAFQGNNSEIVIVSVTGTIVKRIQPVTSSTVLIDLGGIPAGIYFVSLVTPGQQGICHGKLIRQ